MAGIVGDTGIDGVTDVAVKELQNAAGYGTPAEGMRASFILTVLAIAATFLSFGATIALVFLFGIVFGIHFLRWLLEMVM